MLAFPSTVAAKLIGVSYSTFWIEVGLGRIRRTHLKTVSRAELVRYLAESVASPDKKSR